MAASSDASVTGEDLWNEAPFRANVPVDADVLTMATSQECAVDVRNLSEVSRLTCPETDLGLLRPILVRHAGELMAPEFCGDNPDDRIRVLGQLFGDRSSVSVSTANAAYRERSLDDNDDVGLRVPNRTIDNIPLREYIRYITHEGLSELDFEDHLRRACADRLAQPTIDESAALPARGSLPYYARCFSPFFDDNLGTELFDHIRPLDFIPDTLYHVRRQEETERTESEEASAALRWMEKALTKLFLSPPGAVTMPHQDTHASSGWFLQLAGRKQFYFCPPSYIEREAKPVVPRRRMLTLTTNFRDTFAGQKEFKQQILPTIHLAELAQNAKACSLVLEPGDLLILPKKWWHWARSVGDHPSLTLQRNFVPERDLETFWKSCCYSYRHVHYANGADLVSLIDCFNCQARFWIPSASAPALPAVALTCTLCVCSACGQHIEVAPRQETPEILGPRTEKAPGELAESKSDITFLGRLRNRCPECAGPCCFERVRCTRCGDGYTPTHAPCPCESRDADRPHIRRATGPNGKGKEFREPKIKRPALGSLFSDVAIVPENDAPAVELKDTLRCWKCNGELAGGRYTKAARH